MAKTEKDTENKPTIPLLPLRDIVVFPHMVVPLFVGRQRSIAAVESAMQQGKDILLVAQKEARNNEPRPADIFEIGTRSTIVQLLRLPDGTIKVLVEGVQRMRVLRYEDSSEFYLVEAEAIADETHVGTETQALLRSLRSTFETFVKLQKNIPPEIVASVQSIDEATRVADTVAAHLSLKLEQRQEVLQMESVAARIEKLYQLMQGEIEILQVEKRIRSRVRRQMERSQKEYYLNEQMQAIQKELGGRDEFRAELAELEERIRSKALSDEAAEKVGREVRKLKMMTPMSAEATVVRNYIDWVLDLPWGDKSEDNRDIANAEAVLDEDHYGLAKIKERVLEHLAVYALVEKMRGPILCFVGPPGVGKTSLGRSIARALGRKFVRVSLGGVRDEAEIRGHRRTYVGALPGKIVQQLKKAGTANPVFLLDEIDKMSTDFRGDPSSALLEVLDPEQNHTFNDHYLDLDYDLSDVMFITTANELHAIPLALRDRLEVIELTGYSEEEKTQIAKRYLIPKQREANGLAGVELSITDGALRQLVREYTREAGVRNLEREIAGVCRKIARRVVETSQRGPYRVTPGKLARYLGVPKFQLGRREEEDGLGLANGLAVTAHGGDLLPAEVTVMPGSGKLVLTGTLGDVMQESARAALSYVRSRAASFALDPAFYRKVDIHVHCPEGAIPKDGPSAGITIATAMVSALLRIPVRNDVAMTGEITLRGRVLAIGGLKDKLLAAHRCEIRTVLIPEANRKDLKEVPQIVSKSLEIVPLRHMDQVLRHALSLGESAAQDFLAEPSEVVDWRLSSESSPQQH